MNYGYDPGYSYYSYAGVEMIAAFYMLYCIVISAAGIVTYILQSYGMYAIAKRRGIHNPWLAWIPVGDIWMLGCISDQYQYVAKGRVKSKRKTLMVLQILSVVLLIAFFAMFIGGLMQLVSGFYGGMYGYPTDAVIGTLGSMAGVMAIGAAMSVISIVMTVIKYIALFDLYRSCEPDNAVVYLVVGILVGVTQPIFMFLCCKKDGGMPPRKEVNEYEVVCE